MANAAKHSKEYYRNRRNRRGSNKHSSLSYHAYDRGSLLNGRYSKVANLNHGSYGVVSVAHDTKRDNQLVAVKCVLKAEDRAARDLNRKKFSTADDISNELSIHEILGVHPFIISVLDHFESETRAYIVLEYCAYGDLYEAIKGNRIPTDPDIRRQMILDLIDAIDYSHTKGVYHRDIKPENILLTKGNRIKLADWGLATTELVCEELGVGSERYMAPEIFDPLTRQYDTSKADIWAVGICILNILFGRNPFVKCAEQDKLFMDYCRSRESLMDIFPSMSIHTFYALRHALALDPKHRSLSKLRNAIESLEVWTTDDEMLSPGELYSFDTHSIIVTTADREPLRTPTV
ncbi:hypothetical protein CANCADRAFT_22205, partial [Tortispora caseinolytica NRRL Y-17796]